MYFQATNNNTWIFSISSDDDFLKMIMIGYDHENNPHVLKEGFLDIDRIDGSYYDSDGDEKQLFVKIEDGLISFETLPEDYSFWLGTENCKKQGCLGYVDELLSDFKNSNNLEYSITPKDGDFEEAFLWSLNYVQASHPELFQKNIIEGKKNKLNNC